MQPISFNVTLNNMKGLHSKVLDYSWDVQLANEPESDNDDDDDEVSPILKQKQLIKKCLDLSVNYPTMMWPFVGNFKFTLSTEDFDMCKDISETNI